MIIDFRVRPPFKSFVATALYNARDPLPDPVTARALQMHLPAYRSFTARSMEAFIAEMDQAGIGIAVVMGRQSPSPHGWVPNEELVELLTAYPGRFVAFGGVNSSDPAKALEEINRIAAWGFKGVAFDNGWCDPPLYEDDASLTPLYERCVQRGLIASLTSSIYVGPDLTYSDPVHIQRVAKRHPQLKIVVPHAAWPHTVQMCAVAMQCSNVYLVPDFYGHIPNMPGAHEYVRAANYYLGHRLLFASSYPVRPLGQSVEQFRALPFDSEEIRSRCLGLNAARLLGLKA
jgi:predicted TIM-barrel fold metal-dependent hydrolase